MRFRKLLSIISASILVTLAIAPSVVFSDNTCGNCELIATMNFGPNVTITSAELRTDIDNPAGGTIPAPEYCEVRGVRFYDPFIVKLPTSWNERYYQAGNGGGAGDISVSEIDSGMLKGFAAAGASGGHDNNPPFPLYIWGYPPNDPVAQQKIADYCYGSVHETAILAKEMIEAYYCREPDYSYYNSCSTGGRQGLIEAQRYPSDFDGILIGAPVHEHTRIVSLGVWQAQAQLGEGEIALEKLSILADAVMGKCDSIDGLVDGLIDDPRKCTFNALTDLPACPNDIDQPDCFTVAQREAIQKIYEGNPGAVALPGAPFGSEALAPGPFGLASGWAGWIVPTPPFTESFGLQLSDNFIKYLGLPPSGGGGPEWDWTTYDLLGPDPQTVFDNMSAKCDAIDPDLREFKRLGGKIIQWGGWSDPATGAYLWAGYYDEVLDFMGEKKTEKFYKLYMLPGVFHCGGGIGCFDNAGDRDDLFWDLVDWVERKIEPGTWAGSRIVDGEVVRTRPQCPYPKVARYLGGGSIDDAENFTCVELTPAKVRIFPDILHLGNGQNFKAFITLPKNSRKGWGKGEPIVVCEGATAEKIYKIKVKGHKLKKKGKTLIAEFDTNDLINIAPGDDVIFTVTAIFEHKGKQVALEGSDNVMVVE